LPEWRATHPNRQKHAPKGDQEFRRKTAGYGPKINREKRKGGGKNVVSGEKLNKTPRKGSEKSERKKATFGAPVYKNGGLRKSREKNKVWVYSQAARPIVEQRGKKLEAREKREFT